MRKTILLLAVVLFAISGAAVENLSVYDDTLNSNSRVSLQLNSSTGPAYTVIDLDRNGKFDSESDDYALANWTGGTNNSIYYRDFFGPFSENASGDYKIYAVEEDSFEEGISLEGRENVTVNLENIEPTLYNQSLKRENLNFAYTFSSSEKIRNIFVPIYLNHSSHNNIFYKKLLTEDFQEISNNTFQANFTVNYDGNYSVHVDEAIDYHENVGTSNITEKFRVNSVSPIIENPEPSNNSVINESDRLSISIYDRGGGLEKESLKVTVRNSGNTIVENAGLDSDGLILSDRTLEIHPNPLGLNFTEKTEVEIYAEDKYENAAETYLYYPSSEENRGFFQNLWKFFSSII